MAPLIQKRCLRHGDREAVARCPECGEYFCRECITEHDDKIICASCLEKLRVEKPQVKLRWHGPGRAVFALAGVALTIYFYHSLGRVLVGLPPSFHEGTMWKKTLMEAGHPVDE